MQDFGALGEVARLRQLTDIAFDAREPFGLDHRPDVMQHGASDRGRMGSSKQHGEQAAARTADKDRRAYAKRRQDCDDIAEFDRDIVIFRILRRSRTGHVRAS